MQQKKKDFEK